MPDLLLDTLIPAKSHIDVWPRKVTDASIINWLLCKILNVSNSKLYLMDNVIEVYRLR